MQDVQLARQGEVDSSWVLNGITSGGKVDMPEPRLLKKYPNRRLYDTRTSAYITLSDVKELVLSTEVFKVCDAKTGEDITRSILLQIILEEESGGAPLFTTDLLAQMIRFYGNSMHGMLGKYLESNLRAFTDFQQKVQEQSRSLYGDNSNQIGRAHV